MKRRSFIYNSSIAASALSLSTTPLKAKSPPPPIDSNYYMVKSGNFKSDSFFATGLLYVKQPELIETEITKIREDKKYRTKISYASNDKFKIPICTSLVNLFFEAQMSLVVKFKPNHPSDNKVRVNTLKAEAIAECIGDKVINKIVTKNESYYSPSTEYSNSIKDSTGVEIINARVESNNLIQLADLLNGLVYGCLTKHNTNKTKVELLDHFKKKANITNLELGFAIPNKLEVNRYGR